VQIWDRIVIQEAKINWKSSKQIQIQIFQTMKGKIHMKPCSNTFHWKTSEDIRKFENKALLKIAVFLSLPFQISRHIKP
jgi:hypothetical protein